MASFFGCARSLTRSVLVLLFATASLSAQAALEDRSFVETPDAPNVALTVGVADALPGIDMDVKNVNDLVTGQFRFQVQSLENSKGTAKNLLAELEKLAESAGANGTMFFYFSGHGNPGSLEAYDRTVKISEIRAAMERGRRKQGAAERLVMLIDACNSGSLVDPVRGAVEPFALKGLRDDGIRSSILVDEIVRELMPEGRAAAYWKKLFVFASSRADQISLAGVDGSRFTKALVKAFGEVASSGGTMGEFVTKTQAYTVGHNPVARFAPLSLANEKLKP